MLYMVPIYSSPGALNPRLVYEYNDPRYSSPKRVSTACSTKILSIALRGNAPETRSPLLMTGLLKRRAFGLR